MTTGMAAAHEEQSHPLLPSCCSLEENRLAVTAGSAADSLGSGKSGVRSYILQNLRALPSRVVHLVAIDAAVVRDLLVLAVAAGEEEDALVPLLPGVQDVVALAAKLHGAHGGGGGPSLLRIERPKPSFLFFSSINMHK